MKNKTTIYFLYFLAFVSVWINVTIQRLIAQDITFIIARLDLDDKELQIFFWLVRSFAALSVGLAIYSTWCCFRYASVSKVASAINSIAAIFFFPFIMLGQAVWVIQRISSQKPTPAQWQNIPGAIPKATTDEDG